MKNTEKHLEPLLYSNLHEVLNLRLKKPLNSQIESQTRPIDFKIESCVRLPMYELLYTKLESPLYLQLSKQLKHLKQ